MRWIHYRQMHRVIVGCLFALFLVLNLQAQSRFIEMQNRMRVDEATGVPRAIYNIQSDQYSGTPETIARQYLSENRQRLRMKTNLSDLELLEIKESPAGRHVAFRQNYKGIPVIRSTIVVSMNRENRIRMLVTNYRPGISLNVNPSLSRENAIRITRSEVAGSLSDEVSWPTGELAVYQDSLDAFHLVWDVRLTLQGPFGEWTAFVDAQSGQLLEKFETSMSYTNGTGKVFDPDPGTALRDASLTDQNDADYRELQPAYDTVSLFDLNDAISGVYRVQGRYVWSEDIQSPTVPIVTESNPDDFTYGRDQDAFEEVNVYYFIDNFRRYLGTLGFSPTWDYLDPNSETIAIDARGWNGQNARYYSGSEYIVYGVVDVDAGEDQSVVIHEYGHALHDALIPGGIDNGSPDTYGVSEGLSDYFGISYRRTTQANPYRPNHRSNWFLPGAGTSIKTPENAHYPEPQNGGHWGTSPYAKMNVWASTLMDMEYNVATDPEQGVNLTRDVTTRLMLTSLSYVTASSSVQDYVHAILQADRDIPEYDGEHIQELASIFNNRGFFYYDQVSGAVTSNTTWSGAKLVTGGVTVDNDATLTIEPGTYVFFDGDYNFSVKAGSKIIAEGTESDPIYFTSANGTSRQSWGTLYVNGSNNSFKWCTVEYGDWGVKLHGNPDPATNNTIDHCTFRENDMGLRIERNEVVAKSNTIYDNRHGIVTINNTEVEFHGNRVYNNDRDGIYSTSNNYLQLYGNVIENNGVGAYSSRNGIYTRNGDNIELGDLTGAIWGGYNTIRNNYATEVYAGYGDPLVEILEASIHDNTGDEVYNYSGNPSVLAYNTWWGESPPDYSQM